MRNLVERVKQTTQHAARGLRRTPGYSLAVALSLALGLGLNTTVFAIIEGVLLRRLPYPNESELVTVGHVNVRGDAQGASSPTWRSNDMDLQAWSTGTRTLESFAFFSSDHRVVAGTATPEYVDGAEASPSLPRVLGASVDQGRWFTDAEVSARVVVVSHGLWQRQFAGDSAVLGRVLKIQGEPYTVIGVMRRGIGLPLGAQYWVPSTGMDGQVVGRLRDGSRPTVVEQELTALSPSVRNLQGAGYTSTIVVVPLREHLFGSARPALRLVFGAAALLLLIACANIANLSLARSLEREREFAVRITLGASRRSLASLVVIENLLLAVVGAAVGIVLAFWWTRLAVAISPEQIGRADEIGINASCGRKPGSTAIARAKLLVSNPAPVSNMSAVASSATTSARRR
jgi:putative ABC transport system permease protein